jgi:hypothetical protein
MINVLIPVYKGGALFIAALSSVLASCPPSVRLFISFNEKSDEDYARYLAFQKTIVVGNEVVVNRTQAELSAIQHLINIDAWLATHLVSDDQIMFVCHDDEIMEKIPLDSLRTISSQGNCVTFPEWHAYDKEGNFIEIKKITEINLNQSIEDFIFNTFRAGDIYTNLSGITCNVKTFKKFCHWLKYKNTGARMEFMLATASNIKKIRCDENIKLRIRKSPESAGAKITLKNYYYDEMNFMIWLLFNFRTIKYNNIKASFYRFRELYRMYKLS